MDKHKIKCPPVNLHNIKFMSGIIKAAAVFVPFSGEKITLDVDRLNEILKNRREK